MLSVQLYRLRLCALINLTLSGEVGNFRVVLPNHRRGCSGDMHRPCQPSLPSYHKARHRLPISCLVEWYSILSCFSQSFSRFCYVHLHRCQTRREIEIGILDNWNESSVLELFKCCTKRRLRPCLASAVVRCRCKLGHFFLLLILDV